jgi:hypothetical protein
MAQFESQRHFLREGSVVCARAPDALFCPRLARASKEELNRHQAFERDAVASPSNRQGQKDSRRERLVAHYGGIVSKWVKKSSQPLEVEGAYIEYHWYEHPGIGRFEIKEVRTNRP